MTVRSWLLRRTLRALRVPDDAARLLAAHGRLDDPPTTGLPRELAPEVVLALAGALRTRGATGASPGWVWPYWLERQADPGSPAYVPPGPLPLLANVTQRNWTVVGSLDSERTARVDPRGLVTPPDGGWSLDWWIGADDRWHLPSREVAVRQRLLEASPVVETTMSIPSGDAVARVFGVRLSSAEGGGEAAVVEVENRSRVPVALALAVRPCTPEGLTVVERIDLAGGTVSVDGRQALVLARPPARVAGSSWRDGDSAAVVTGGGAGERWRRPVRDPAGLAQAAFVVPLAHGATFRAVIPLTERAGGTATFPAVLPPAAAVAAGWQAQADRGLGLALPDGRLAAAVAAARRHLLLRPGGDPAVATALDACGYHDQSAAALAAIVARARPDGSLGTARSTGATLVALDRHWRLARDTALARAMVEPVAAAVQWVERARRSGGGDATVAGLLPPGPAAPGAGPAGRRFVDDLWAVAGLRAAAGVLEAADQPEAAADARGFATAMWRDVEAALDRGAEHLGTPAVPDGPGRAPGDGGPAAAALELLAPDDPRLAATAEAVRSVRAPGDGRAVFDLAAGGLSPALTLSLAGAELRAGDRRCLDRLGWLLDVATPTWTWPTLVHPRLGGGCGGDGHDPAVAAGLLGFVRDLLVREDGDEHGGGVALASLVPDGWYGHGWEVHAAPTAHGRVSYAVRWHGDRVALLWEVEPHPGAEPVRLTAPGLDRSWSTTDARGEALLGPVPGGPDTPAQPAGLRVGAAPPADPGPAPDDGASFA
jgi:hypothetical protein